MCLRTRMPQLKVIYENIFGMEQGTVKGNT